MRIIITTDVKSEVLISEGMLNVINPVKVEFEEMRRPKPDITEIADSLSASPSDEEDGQGAPEEGPEEEAL